MKIDEQRRKLIANAMVDNSFLNIGVNTQFNAPSYPTNQNLVGAGYSEDRTKFIMLGNGVGGTTPTNQKRLYCYTNSNPIGIAESASNLTYVGLSNDLVFEISGVRQQIANGIHWDSDLGKIWVHHTTNTAMISEYNFNFSTLTATYVQSKVLSTAFDSGNFYFNPSYTKLFISSASTSLFQEYSLAIPADISTAILTSSAIGVPFTNFPIFFESGSSAIFSFFAGGSGQNNLRKTQLSTAYNINTFVGGYNQPLFRTAVTGYRVTAQLPIIASIGLKKINYFNNSNNSGGMIGVGTFDAPLDFEGLGSGLGGVKVGTTIIT